MRHLLTLIWTMNERTAATLCVLVALLFTLAVKDLG